jgi:hypothetical protein
MVPLVGLERGLEATPTGWPRTLGDALTADGAKIVLAPGGTPPDPRSDARGHGDFDDDRATMTSVLLRMLDVTEPRAGSYVPDQPIADLPPAPPSGTTIAVTRPSGAAEDVGRAAAALPAVAGLRRRAATEVPEFHVPVEAAVDPAVASPTFQVLYDSGYTAVAEPGVKRAARRTGR